MVTTHAGKGELADTIMKDSLYAAAGSTQKCVESGLLRYAEIVVRAYMDTICVSLITLRNVGNFEPAVS